MTVKAIMPARTLNLVGPLPHKGTAMRPMDTAAQAQDRSRAVSAPIGESLRHGDVDSPTHRSTRATTRGARTSATATRTTTTRTTSWPPASSADSDATPTFQELLEAYLDCRRRKRNTASALNFELRLEYNLCRLYEELLDGSYRPGRSICFVVTRPKAREVWAADFRDRIVHHLLYNRIADRFHARFIAASCACIPGRGTLYAAELLEHDARSVTQNWARPAWYLKCDLANFFVAIDKRILRAQLHAHIHDPWWRDLTDLVLMHDPRQDVEVHSPAHLLRRVPAHKSLFNAPEHTGLPIGNLSSQFFANVHLDALDQYAKHRLRARYYVRYVDDFVLMHQSPAWLNAALAEISTFLPERLHAQLNPRKTILQPVARGIDFVGHVVKPWRRVIRPRVVATALQRVEHLDRADVYTTGNSYLGLLRQASHSHRDRVALGKALRYRGHTIDGDLTRIFRSKAT